jgi:serine/threonine protein kinase
MGEAGRTELWGRQLDGRYQLFEPLGSGATGVVLAGEEIASGRAVAVKVLRTELAARADLAARLRREAEVGRAVRHPGLPALIDEGTLEDW